MKFWTNRVAEICPLFTPAKGNTRLSAIDTLITKAVHAGEKLDPADMVELRMLMPESWGVAQLNQRVENLKAWGVL